MNVHDGKVHLSVNHEGRVSLWDTKESAFSGMEPGETQLDLELTQEQLNQIQQAAGLAIPPRPRFPRTFFGGQV